MPADDRPARPGRPRAVPDASSALSPRDQVLDAAAALFVEHGFGATSTRAIADRVGIRQASLYYHFAGKDDVLVELLETSVRPSLVVARELDERVPGSVPAAVALAALVAFDVGTLARTPHNVGTLYLLPEAQGERFAGFRADRQALQDVYGRLGTLAATPDVARTVEPAQLGGILIQLVETVIQLRRVGEVGDHDRTVITSSCLRVCGLDPAAVDAAQRDAASLLATVAG
ncbi:helix-turn-helix domain-containing protein [Curtobacterium luteum]|uniref:TetR/AcrR family transcriptional regulator n=1 Tax=Curtobacterium luteum TaxID=33881 RepID=UPI0038261D1D